MAGGHGQGKEEQRGCHSVWYLYTLREERDLTNEVKSMAPKAGVGLPLPGSARQVTET